jgi:DNA polymerase-3 subunit beta
MRFNCERSVLLREIALANEFIGSKASISILSNIMLIADKDSLTIRSTDTKVYFETKVPVSVVEEGETTVYGDKFLGILNSIPDGNVEFEQNDQTIVIKPVSTSTKIRFNLRCIASDSYPVFTPPEEGKFFEIPIVELKEMINQTIFAVSDDETRYFMNGVFFERQESKLVMVGTDGRRLAYIEKEVPMDIQDFNGIIIPTKILNFIQRHAGDEGLISLRISDNMIHFHFVSYQLSSVLIEGSFPNYRKVIPESQDHSFTVNRLEMLNAIRRASLMVEKKSQRIYVNLEQNSIAINSEESEQGDAREEIPCQYSGDDMAMALNYRYIEEPLKVITGDDIHVAFTDSKRAITIGPMEKTGYFHIVMPMNLD